MNDVCPVCGGNMKIGIGINPTRPDRYKNALGGPEGLITHKYLILSEVIKCISCGHSKDIIKDA